MGFDEKIEKLTLAIAKDEEKILLLQDGIKEKQDKIKSLNKDKLLQSINNLSAKGMDVSKIICAIEKNDVDTLLTFADEINNKKLEEKHNERNTDTN